MTFLGDFLYQLFFFIILFGPVALIVSIVIYIRKQDAKKKRKENKLKLLVKSKEHLKK